MESGGKRLKQWVLKLKYLLNSFLTVFNRVKNRKVFMQLLVVLVLFILSLLAYFFISSQNRVQESFKLRIYSREMNEGINNYRLENYERAKIIFNDIAQNSRNRIEVAASYIYLGNIEYRSGNLRKALDYYKKAETKSKKYMLFSRLNSALVLMQLGELKEAIKLLREVSEDRDFPAEGGILLGCLYFLDGDYKKSSEMFKKYYGHPVAMYNLSVVELKMKNFDEARTILKSISSNEKIDPVIRGLSYYRMGDLVRDDDPNVSGFYYQKALDIFSQSDDLIYNTAIQLARSGKYARSYSLLKKLRGYLKNDTDKLLLGAIAFYSGNINDSYSTLLEVNNPGKDKRAYLYTLMGEVFIKKGMFGEAEKYLLKAYSIDDFEPAAVKLIDIYRKSGNGSKALKFCSDKVVPMAKSVSLLIECAGVYFDEKKEKKGFEILDRASKLAGTDERYLIEIARVYYKYNYYNMAQMILSRVLDSNPENWKAKLVSAKIFQKLGQNTRALKILRSLIERCSDTEIYYKARILEAELSGTTAAERVYRELIEDFPYRYEPYYNLARLLNIEGKYRDSFDVINKILGLDIEIPGKVLANLYTLKGIDLYHLGRVDEAVESFNIACMHDSKCEVARVNLRVLKSIGK